MPLKPLLFTMHAQLRMYERHIPAEWVEFAARTPDWTERDPRDPTIERRFRAINEFGGRILRVACVETATNISLTFDRNARPNS